MGPSPDREGSCALPASLLGFSYIVSVHLRSLFISTILQCRHNFCGSSDVPECGQFHERSSEIVVNQMEVVNLHLFTTNNDATGTLHLQLYMCAISLMLSHEASCPVVPKVVLT